MRTAKIGLILLGICIGFTTLGNESALGDEIKIENGRGSSEQGCEITNLCFIPAYAVANVGDKIVFLNCLLYTSPSPRDRTRSRMPSSA